MPNRQLTDAERRDLFAPLIEDVRARLHSLSKGDDDLLWALRRKLAKELSYDERGKPMHRVMLKMQKRVDQLNRCAICGTELPDPGAVLDRLEAMKGYTKENTRLLCPPCDTREQQRRGYA
jgi:UTP:GlnB (protein PII) uridylyltransferase